VIDFAKALADPGHPLRMDPAFDSGDHLHPNGAGYRAMAAAVSLRMLLR
jgi:lysophospholipase L1-like esterase